MIAASKPVLTRTYDLGQSREQDAAQRTPTFRGVANVLGRLWAFGSDVLLFSDNGSSWRNVAPLLGLQGSFVVSSVMEAAGELFVFAYDKDGLHCFQIEPRTWKCTRFPSVPSASPRALSANGRDGLVVCANEGYGSEFWHFRNSRCNWEKLPEMLPGVATFLEVKGSGSGICALWGITSADGVALPSPSLIYRTCDFGESWSAVQQVDSMLLGGAAAEGRPTILGGTNGFIAEETTNGFKEIYGPCPDEVSALCARNTQQAAVLASSEEPLRQALLLRARTAAWQQFDVQSLERIQSITFIRFGVLLLCTQSQLLACKLELLH